MKHIKVLFLSLVISLLSFPSWSETFDDLVERNGLFYKKFTDTPFTCEISDEGNRQLKVKENYKDGEKNGVPEKSEKMVAVVQQDFDADLSVYGCILRGDSNGEQIKQLEYEKDQQLRKKRLKDGELDGVWESYYGNGQLRWKENYKDGELDGVWESYYGNGQLRERENYKDGEKDGVSESYYENGQLNEKRIYKDGELEGLMKIYNEDGSLDKIGIYKNGALVSE